MKRPVKGIIISTFAVLIAVAGAGCYQQQSQGTKRTKLIAAENMRLKKELAELEKEIERLKQLHQEQLIEKQSRLNQCQKETSLAAKITKEHPKPGNRRLRCHNG